MGNPPRQSPEGFHFMGPLQPGLQFPLVQFRLLAFGYVITDAEYFNKFVGFVKNRPIGPGGPYLLTTREYVFTLIGMSFFGKSLHHFKEVVQMAAGCPLQNMKHIIHIFADYLVRGIPEKPLGVFIEKGYGALGVDAHDDTVGIFHQFTIYFFTLLKFLKGHGVHYADRRLGSDPHQQIDIAGQEGPFRPNIVHAQNTDGFPFIDNRHTDKRLHAYILDKLNALS